MKTKLLTTTIGSILIVALALPAQAGLFGKRTIKGSGDIVTQTREIGQFDRIRANGSFDVFVTIGNEQKITVSFDDNLIDLIETDVKGRTLRLDSEGSYSSRKSCRVDITVPSLEAILVSGSGDFVVEGLDGGEFEYEVGGSSDATLSGTVDEIHIEISGSGDVDARNLKAKRAYVEIAGSGDVDVWADELFEGNIYGSGDIAYYGNPEKVTRQVFGSGDIRKRR